MDDYCSINQDIIKLEFRSFFIYVLDVKWFKDVVERCPNATIIFHPSGFVIIVSRVLAKHKGHTSFTTIM